MSSPAVLSRRSSPPQRHRDRFLAELAARVAFSDQSQFSQAPRGRNAGAVPDARNNRLTSRKSRQETPERAPYHSPRAAGSRCFIVSPPRRRDRGRSVVSGFGGRAPPVGPGRRGGREPRRRLRSGTMAFYNWVDGIHELGQGVPRRAAGPAGIRTMLQCRRPDSSSGDRSCHRESWEYAARSVHSS
jgi:hypothetical protein